MSGNATSLLGGTGVLAMVVWRVTGPISITSVTLGGVSPSGNSGTVTSGNDICQFFWWTTNNLSGTNALVVNFNAALAVGGANLSALEFDTPFTAGNSGSGADPYTFNAAQADPSLFAIALGASTTVALPAGYTNLVNNGTIWAYYDIGYKLSGNTIGNNTVDGVFSQVLMLDLSAVSAGGGGGGGGGADPAIENAVADAVLSLIENLVA